MTNVAFKPLNQSNTKIQGYSSKLSFNDLLLMYGNLVTPVQTCTNIETKNIYTVPSGKISFLVGFNHFIYCAVGGTSGNGRSYIRLNETLIYTYFMYFDDIIRGNENAHTTTQSFAIPLKLTAGTSLDLESTDFTSQVSTVTLFVYELDVITFNELFKN